MITNDARSLAKPWLVLLLLLVAPAAESMPRGPRTPPRISSDAADGTWSVAADDIDLVELLTALERRTGLTVEIAGRLERRLSVHLVDTPPARALRQILRGENYVLRHPSSARRTSHPGGSLWVYAAGAERQATVHLAADGCDALLPCTPAAGSAVPEAHRSPDADLLAALADPNTLRALDLLTATALTDPSAAIRLEAVYGLGERHDEAALPVLERALSDADHQVRREAVAALSDLGGEGAAWALVPALEASDARLREEAVYALGEIGGAAAVVLLRQALADPAGAIRETAALMLDELEATP